MNEKMKKSNNENAEHVSCEKIEKVLEEFEEYIRAEVEALERKISKAKCDNASEYYISDMKGFVRGISYMGTHAINFIKQKLIKAG